MSRTSKTLLRLGVPSLAAATLVAGVPAFLVGTAQAAPGDTLTQTPATASAPAGVCTVFTTTINPVRALTVVDVQLAPRTNNVDANFCTLNLAGTTVATNTGTAGGGATERAEFTTDNNGRVSFGVIVNVPGVVDVTSFVESPDQPAPAAVDNFLQTSEPQVNSVLTTTGAGLDAVATVDAEPETGTELAQNGTSYEYDARVLNSAGQGIPGIAVFRDVTSGPDAALPAGTCGVTDQSGTVTCSVPSNGGVGTDSIVTYVNTAPGTTGSPTSPTEFDAADVNDVITRNLQAALAAGATVTLTADGNRVGAANDTRQNPLTDPTAEFSATVRNAAGVVVSGALVTFEFTSARTSATSTATTQPESATTAEAADTVAPLTAVTNAQGVATVVVNNSLPVTGDRREILARIATGTTTADDLASVTYRQPDADEARNVTLSPATATRVVGDVQAYSSTVTDRFGNPVQGAVVTFSESGPGRFAFGSTTTSVTNASGVATAELLTSIGETAGTNTVTASLPTTTGALNDECEQPVNTSGFVASPITFGGAGTGNQPGAPAGNCTATAVVVFTASPVSPTRPATPTATATPTAGTGTPTPRPTGIACTNPAGITLDRSVTRPGRPVKVTVRSAPNSVVELLAYSRPSTTYRVARQAEVGASGVVEFMVVPGTNTRLFAQCVSQTRSASASVVINVRTAISLTVVRNSTRNYTFKGTILPKRAGQLISLYRVNANGTRVLSAQVKTDASGVYSFNRRFTGSGVFGFVTRTGQNLTNAAGESNTPDSSTTGVGTPRRTAIF